MVMLEQGMNARRATAAWVMLGSFPMRGDLLLGGKLYPNG